MKLQIGLLLAGGGGVLAAVAAADATPALTQTLGAPVTRALDLPVFVTSWPGNPDILLVAERGSRKISLWQLSTSPIQEATFLDLTSKAWLPTGTNDFLGVTGFAFHPLFLKDPTKRFVYVRYNDVATTHTRIEAYTVPPGSQKVEPAIPPIQVYTAPTTATGHGSGTLHFDNRFNSPARLWVPMPDNADANIGFSQICQDAAKVQDVPVPTDFGKLLAIDVDASPPVVGIRATGLRNPFGFSVDTGQIGTGLGRGDVWMGDTGWNTTGNVYRHTPSSVFHNYGWPWQTGDASRPWVLAPQLIQTVCGASSSNGEPSPPPSYTAPYAVFSDVEEYGMTVHDALIGGYVYRQSEVSVFTNQYVFATYGLQGGGPRIYSLPASGGGTAVASDWTLTTQINAWPAGSLIHALGQDAEGELYIVRVESLAASGLLSNGAIFAIKP